MNTVVINKTCKARIYEEKTYKSIWKITCIKFVDKIPF